MSGSPSEPESGGADQEGRVVRYGTRLEGRPFSVYFVFFSARFFLVMDPHQRESVRRGTKRAFVIRERSVDEARQFFQRYFSPCGFMGGSRHEAHHFVEEARSGKGDEDMFPCLFHLCLRDGSAEVTLRNGARFIAAQGGKSSEVMRSPEQVYSLFQNIHAPCQRAVPGQPGVKRVEDGSA